MRTLMGTQAHVHYSQIYVVCEPDDTRDGMEWPGLEALFAGQSNGLCGAAVPGQLFLTTGLHTGSVGFSVELHDGPPPVGDAWEDVVEVTFCPVPGSAVYLEEWGGGNAWPLPLADARYRARYCAAGMDAGRDLDTRLDSEPEADRYLLQFWPAPDAPDPTIPGSDRIIRQASENAAYWHDFAQQLPPPPSPEEQAAIRATREYERAQAEREQQRAVAAALHAHTWGDYQPSERVRGLPANASALARLDPALLDALDAAAPVTQRSIARWAARRACEEAQMTRAGWVAAALDAMDRGEPLPPELGGPTHLALRVVMADPDIPHTTITTIGGTTSMVQQSPALVAWLAVTREDPLAAATEALWQGANAFGTDRYEVLFSELRATFPAAFS